MFGGHLENMDDPNNVPGVDSGEPQTFGLLGCTPFAGKAQVIYVCDGSRTRKGERQTLVWDGKKFLPIAGAIGSNHAASYLAVQMAMRDALSRGFVSVELRVTSDLIYRQLITGAYCRSSKLGTERQLTIDLASKVGDVRLALVTQGFQIDRWTVDTRRRLRCVNRRFQSNAGNLDAACKTCGC